MSRNRPCCVDTRYLGTTLLAGVLISRFLGNRVRLFDSFILARMFFFFNSTLWCLWAGPLAVQSRQSNSRKTNDFQAVCLVKWRCVHGLSKMWHKLHKSGTLVENITVVFRCSSCHHIEHCVVSIMSMCGSKIKKIFHLYTWHLYVETQRIKLSKIIVYNGPLLTE